MRIEHVNPGGARVFISVEEPTTIKIGVGVTIGEGVTLGHSVKIGSFSTIAAGVKIGNQTKIEADVGICEGVKIGHWVRIESRSVVGEGVKIWNNVRLGYAAKICANSNVGEGEILHGVTDRTYVWDAYRGPKGVPWLRHGCEAMPLREWTAAKQRELCALHDRAARRSLARVVNTARAFFRKVP